MVDYATLSQRWQDSDMSRWAAVLAEQVAAGLSHQRYGDLASWERALAALPDIAVDKVILDNSSVGASSSDALDDPTRSRLHEALMGLHPWRKGPYQLFDVHIDTEWRSDWKWNRLQQKIDPLAGRRVLDVGCGSGYHCWRMLGDGAAQVIGIDPNPLFVTQFLALQKYLQQDNIWVLPVGIADVPGKLQAFDTVFSMGVLYHRRSPIDHLQELKECLRPGGQLVLETLVIKGELGDVLVPEGRYARMGNVWFLPSCDTLLSWLRKIGFEDAQLIDVTVTTPGEQRSTDWMHFHSLSNFLNPNDHRKSIEGHPAPRRAIITAQVPA